MSPTRLPARVRARLAALPLRVRLVAGFAVAVTVVLAAAGSFVYWRVSYALDLRLDDDLRAEAAVLGPQVGADGSVRLGDALARSPGARRYQVLDAAGAVLDHGTDLAAAPLLTARQAREAQRGEVVVDVGSVLPVSPQPLRLLAGPVDRPGPARVLLVADRRDGRDEALRELLAQLLLAGLGALVVTSVVGERLALAALRPVERYRTQAARIAAGAHGVRLDVPPQRDDEVTRLGHTLNEVLDALEQALDRERRFTQDASHELRTPLTLLSTRVQVALRRPRSQGEHEVVLRELADDVHALSDLADQLLALSTWDVGTPDVGTPDPGTPDPGTPDLGTPDHGTPDPAGPGADLAAVVRTVLAHHRPPPAVDAGPLPVAMGGARLRQVVTNLVGNAATHGAAPVLVRVREVGGVAMLTVSDAGPGVDPAFLPVAADRFARADDARGRPGAGLGLALVRALVEGHGGELRLCSAGVHQRYADRFPLACEHPAAGTTASVLLPTR